MKRFNMDIVTEEKRELLQPYHRVFQGIVSLFSNIEFKNFECNLIFKCEGGIVVNKREIAIHEEYVIDDFKHNFKESTKEEEVVVKIIEDIFTNVDFNNLPNSLQEWVNERFEVIVSLTLTNFIENPFGDPLRSFFDF